MKKEKSCLITQQLIGAIDWYRKAPHSVVKPEHGGDGEMTWKDKAFIDLKNSVNRIYGEFSPEAKQGIEFEKKVYAMANKENRPGSELFNQVCDEVMGFQFYQKGGKYLKVSGHTCYIFCKYDAILKPIIKDIKTTKKYKKGYIDGVQHLLYCYVGEANKFEYIIAEWETYPKIKAIYKEEYRVENSIYLEDTIKLLCEQTLEDLKDLGLWEDYREKFCLY